MKRRPARTRPSRDIHEHIESETRDNIERGMAPEEARDAAMRKFGNVRASEDDHAVWQLDVARSLAGRTSATRCGACAAIPASRRWRS